MSLMTNPLVLRMRRALRTIGIPKLFGYFIGEYEQALARQLYTAIHQDDVVWDVGANIGYYTLIFSDLVGPRGKVFAFEPDRSNLAKLRSSCEGKSNIVICNFGLSNRAWRANFLEGTDNLRATSRVLESASRLEGVTEVELRAADEIITAGDADIPNVIKIDVEGHELRVLEGMSEMLVKPELRRIFIEVHFSVLDQAGRSNDPRLIENLLKKNCFKIDWIDMSHILVSRRT